jgi:hypothetical protein
VHVTWVPLDHNSSTIVAISWFWSFSHIPVSFIIKSKLQNKIIHYFGVDKF